MAEHAMMAPLLDRLHGEDGERTILEAVHGALARLAELWPAHIEVEETRFSLAGWGPQ